MRIRIRNPAVLSFNKFKYRSKRVSSMCNRPLATAWYLISCFLQSRAEKWSINRGAAVFGNFIRRMLRWYSWWWVLYFDARCQPRWGSQTSPVPTRAFSGSTWSSHPLPRPGIIRHSSIWLIGWCTSFSNGYHYFCVTVTWCLKVNTDAAGWVLVALGWSLNYRNDICRHLCFRFRHTVQDCALNFI